ncbi:hypothetical protein FNN89_20200 [Salmonella enterica subsp. salamae]|nr:hypothetical protein [Salmonella enterica subsp. salamae]
MSLVRVQSEEPNLEKPALSRLFAFCLSYRYALPLIFLRYTYCHSRIKIARMLSFISVIRC